MCELESSGMTPEALCSHKQIAKRNVNTSRNESFLFTSPTCMAGEPGKDVEWVRRSIQDEALVLPPVVITELFSARNLPAALKGIISDIPTLDLLPGYWQRSGEVRAKLLTKGKKACLADTMVAVCCMDHPLPLIARDGDYRHFVKLFGLDLRMT